MLDHDTDIMTFQSDYQLNGTAAHESIDAGKYSSKKEILMGIELKKLKNAVPDVMDAILLKLLMVNFTVHLLTRHAMKL